MFYLSPFLTWQDFSIVRSRFSPQLDYLGYRGHLSRTARLTQGLFHFSSNRLLTAGIKGHRGVLVLSAAEEKMVCWQGAGLHCSLQDSQEALSQTLFFSLSTLSIMFSLALSLSPSLFCLFFRVAHQGKGIRESWGLKGGRPAHYWLSVQTGEHTWLHWHGLITWPGDRSFFSARIRASPGPRLQRAAWLRGLSPQS